MAAVQARQETLYEQVRQRMKFKERSRAATVQEHLPLLDATIARHQSSSFGTQHADAHAQPLHAEKTVVLLGDGRLARLRLALGHAQILDLSVAGDRIENVLYRLDLGVLDRLARLQPELVVVHVGMHNVGPRKALGGAEKDSFSVLLRTLLSGSSRTKVAVAGLFPRPDMNDKTLALADCILRDAAAAIGKAEGLGRVCFVPAPLTVNRSHVAGPFSLNDRGAELWSATMQHLVDGFLKGDDMSQHAFGSDSQNGSSTECSADCEELGRKTSPYPSLRPAQAILARILHDTDRYNAEKVVVGYEDRQRDQRDAVFSVEAGNNRRRLYTDASSAALPAERIRGQP